MKQVMAVVLAAVMYGGCAQAVLTLDNGSFSVCKDNMAISNAGEFLNETADNIRAEVNGNTMTVQFDVRKKTDSNLSFAAVQQNNQIRITVTATPSGMQELCTVTANVVLKNVGKGKYDLMVMNADGTLLLANKSGVEVK